MKTKYDWRSIPYWAQYVALDSDGDMCAYESKPEMHSSGLFWKKHIGGNCLKIKNIGPCENWQDSLEERPHLNGAKYDWRNIPDWVSYVAIQRNGDKFGYDVAPVLHGTGYWVSYIGQSYLLENVGPCENWKDSLERRPNVLGTKEEIEDVVKMVLLDNGIDYGTEVRFFNIASDCAEAIIRRLGIKP